MKRSRDADPSHGDYLRRRPRRARDYRRTSRYLVMRDGTKIAVDVCVPNGLGSERVPTILRQTRYFRRFQVHPALRRVLGADTLDPMNAPMRALMTSRGYAWVDVDARGSGASFGERPCPWWLDGEVADGAEIVEWITRQPWSNGRVGSTGVSYDGTTAEFLAITGHPAVRAIAPRFSLFDVYTDVAFPGGLHNAYFTEAWESANAALDRNAPGEMVALVYLLRLHGALDPALARALDRPLTANALSAFFTRALAGVAPVDDDVTSTLLRAALGSHGKNYNVHDGAVETRFRDDSPKNSPIPGQTSDLFSPHSYVDRIGSVAVLGYGGWYDGAYAGAAVKRHQALVARGKDSRLLIGPWVHGGQLDQDPDAPVRPAAFDHAAELLRFFDQYLEAPGRVAAELPRVRYYSMGEGRWRAAETWPPPGMRETSLHLSPGRELRRQGVRGGFDVSEMRLDVGAGKRSRWRTLLCPFLNADGAGRSPDGYLVYDSAPLERALTIAGSPLLALSLASSRPDTAVVVYLEDVDGRGRGRGISEGELRTLHRTNADGSATFLSRDALALAPMQRATHHVRLLPVAHRFAQGHRVRLVLGAADVDHFATPAGSEPARWSIGLSESVLRLPVM